MAYKFSSACISSHNFWTEGRGEKNNAFFEFSSPRRFRKHIETSQINMFIFIDFQFWGVREVPDLANAKNMDL